ncbi:hypothetical protein BDR04DRAFT_1092483 [Suillus decipiens]|nr:hypothetical protein BDR04DRAFT_1092483 [Suillus decipiens]
MRLSCALGSLPVLPTGQVKVNSSVACLWCMLSLSLLFIKMLVVSKNTSNLRRGTER